MKGCARDSALKKLYMIFAIILALKSMKFFYFDTIPSIPLQIVVLSIGILLLQGRRYNSIVHYGLLSIILILNFVFVVLNNQAIGNIINFLLILSLCLQDDELKKNILTNFAGVFSIILFASLIVYVPHLCGVQFLQKHAVEFDGRLFRCDYLCLYSDSITTRFQGLFLEPGHIGMIIAFVLFCRGYNLRSKHNWVLILSLILSFSLAGYILAILGLVMSILLQRRLSFKNIFLTIICLGSLAMFAIKRQDNIFYELIFRRLEFDGGTMAGDNRYTPVFEGYYELNMKNRQYLLFGMQNKFNINTFPGNAGYKVYLIENGVIALAFLFLRYCAILYAQFSFRGFALLILFSLSFLQRPYADWFVMYLLFVCALPYFITNKKHACKSVYRQVNPIKEICM